MAWAIAAALAAVLMADLPPGWGISGDLDGCTRRGAAYRLSTAEARRANASLQASPSPGRHDFLVAESRTFWDPSKAGPSNFPICLAARRSANPSCVSFFF